MPNLLLRILLLNMFFLITVSNFATESTQKTNKIYSIGTGISLNYKGSDFGFMIDYYNILHFRSRPFDKLLIKLGIGLNYNSNPLVDQMTANITFVTSIGYLYVQKQSHQLSHLKQFGVGFTVDYTMITTTSHGIGVTVYTVLNPFLLGLGGGFVLSSHVDFQPYVMSSIGFTF